MTQDEIKLLRRCEPGTRIRIISHKPKEDARWWWERKENRDVLASRGVVIEGTHSEYTKRPRFSMNKGFTGYVLLGAHNGHGWSKFTHVMLYNAKIEIWKDGELTRDIRIG